ncbi:MAG: FAD-dependent oxidoreductase [Phycisphaeraceae bacterium]|nr:FAD-dependent oxidoreductase [Phycisphaeraceae bacterium]
MAEQSVIVVGGGVIGACCAYYLRKSGWDVTIVERETFGAACSHGNCGLISPSHALPLAVPGTIAKTLPMMFKRDAPLRVAPRFDPTLWAWLMKFATRCKEAPMLEAAAGRHALLQSSVTLYKDLFDAEGIDCEWESRGAYFIYQSGSGMDSYVKSDKWLQQFGLGAERISGEQMESREPSLKPGTTAGAWYYEMDAHLRPDKLMQGLKATLEKIGVTVLEGTSITGFAKERGEAAALRTSAGDMQAGRYVLATGAWTPKLNEWIGTKIPIQPGKGYSITYPRPGSCPAAPLAFMEQKVIVTPFKSGYRLGSTMEFAGYDSTINKERLGALKRGASLYLHEPYCEPEEEQWYGWRPMTYDGKPVIDTSPAMSNVAVAAGHNMLGLSMGSATGKLVDEMLSDGQPHIDLKPFAIDRF